MKRIIAGLCGFGVMMLMGCDAPYAPAAQIVPSHIQKISIQPIINNTSEYGLEEKLTLEVVNEFVRDGRFAIVTDVDESDGVVIAEIKKYILQPLTYDANLVTTQYKLWVLLNVYFVDKVKNVTLWSEPNMEAIQVFYEENQPGGKTEEEVRETMWEILARDIVKRTVEGFGAVSGTSERKIPK